jgi:enterochelin esterase-like enzyme
MRFTQPRRVWPLLLAASAALAATPTPRKPTVVTLRSKVFQNTRQLRVPLPPGYYDPKNQAVRYPVFYFLDGIATFDAWGVPATVEDLWTRREIPEMLFVGIDNGESTRETAPPSAPRFPLANSG